MPQGADALRKFNRLAPGGCGHSFCFEIFSTSLEALGSKPGQA
jgi:hypothetical protein